MFNPNKNFQQQQNQAQQQQFQNAFTQANKLQQNQFQNFINRSHRRTKANADRQMEDARRHGVAAGIAAAEASRRRRLQSAIPQAQPAPGQREYAWHNGPAYQCWSCHAFLRTGSAYCTCGEPVHLSPFGQVGIKKMRSWKKSIGVLILIAAAVLALDAALQTHSSPATPVGTPGVISVGANIRTGPGTGNSMTAVAPAGTRIIIRCRIATSAGKWDKLLSPYQGLFVSATLVHSHRPPRC